MQFIWNLLGMKRHAAVQASEIASIDALGDGGGPYIELYYSTLRESRPYVIAMREVACDSLRSA